MKKFIFLSVIFTSLLFTYSCKDEEDYTNPENLKGTSWICNNMATMDPAVEYTKATFTSTSAFEGRSKRTGLAETLDYTGNYTISGNTITMVSPYNTYMGTISGEKMSVVIEGITYVYTKE